MDLFRRLCRVDHPEPVRIPFRQIEKRIADIVMEFHFFRIEPVVFHCAAFTAALDPQFRIEHGLLRADRTELSGKPRQEDYGTLQAF